MNTYYHPFPPERHRFAWIEVEGVRYRNANFDGDINDLFICTGEELPALVAQKKAEATV